MVNVYWHVTQNSLDSLTMRLVLQSTLIHASIYHMQAMTLLSLFMNYKYICRLGLATSGQFFVNTLMLLVWCSLLQIKGRLNHFWGMGGHITVYPVSKHQFGAKAKLKCSSIVCLSSFVHLTNEENSDTGWEQKGEEASPTNGSRCTKTANICTAASVVNK